MYYLLPIACVSFLVAAGIVRRYSKTWLSRPLTRRDAIVGGSAAWVCLAGAMAWFLGCVWIAIDFFTTYDLLDTIFLIPAFLLTVYAIDISIRSRYELGLDDVWTFAGEAIRFRRSPEHRVDLLEMMQERRGRRLASRTSDGTLNARARLQATLNREKDLDAHLIALREGKTVDISAAWHANTKTHPADSFFGKVGEVRIDPLRKRFAMHADFPGLNEARLQDDMEVLRFNRQTYDFLQAVNAEEWLHTYSAFVESYFLICRGTKMNKDGTSFRYPFLKLGILVTDLRKLEGSYFNPRNLSDIAALAFNHGEKV